MDVIREARFATILRDFARPLTPQEAARAAGQPIPDERRAYLFHAACPACGAALELVVDVSCGPHGEVGAECEGCGALPIWRVDWWYAVEVCEYVRDDRKEKPR